MDDQARLLENATERGYLWVSINRNVKDFKIFTDMTLLSRYTGISVSTIGRLFKDESRESVGYRDYIIIKAKHYVTSRKKSKSGR